MLWTKIDSQLQLKILDIGAALSAQLLSQCVRSRWFQVFWRSLGKFMGPMALWPLVRWVPTALWPWIGDAWLFVCHDLFRGTGNVIFFFSMYFLFGDLSSLGIHLLLSIQHSLGCSFGSMIQKKSNWKHGKGNVYFGTVWLNCIFTLWEHEVASRGVHKLHLHNL